LVQFIFGEDNKKPHLHQEIQILPLDKIVAILNLQLAEKHYFIFDNVI